MTVIEVICNICSIPVFPFCSHADFSLLAKYDVDTQPITHNHDILSVRERFNVELSA